ncbi:MAG TPA: hypothetical protein VG944_05435 [Fimbriimonas sp.]|nr:hypothetical protein [Fimbriimonas sp.]
MIALRETSRAAKLAAFKQGGLTSDVAGRRELAAWEEYGQSFLLLVDRQSR